MSGGHRNDGKGDAYRRQPAVPAYPVGHGRPARCGGHGQPLRTALDRPLGLPPVVRRSRGPAASLQPHIQPVRAHRQQRRGTAPLRENGEEHAVALAVQPPERHQPRVDRGIPERSALTGAEVRPRPLQRDGVERRRGGAETHQERRGQPAGFNGLRAAPQHDGLPDAVLGGHPRQRGGLPGGRSVPHVHRAGGVPLRRRDQLQGLALRLRHPHGGPDKRQAAAHRHLRPADEAGRDDEQKQVRIGPFGKRQVILHEPPCQAVLRTRIPRGAGRYGQLLPRAVRDDTPQDEGQGRHLLHLHGGKAHLVQPVLHGRRGVRRGKEGQHQDAAAYPVEKRERTRHENGVGGTGQRGERLHPENPAGQEHRAVVQLVLRVHAGRVPQGDGGTLHQGGEDGLQHRQLPDHAPAVLPGRTVRLPAQLHGEHRPAAQAVRGL